MPTLLCAIIGRHSQFLAFPRLSSNQAMTEQQTLQLAVDICIFNRHVWTHTSSPYTCRCTQVDASSSITAGPTPPQVVTGIEWIGMLAQEVRNDILRTVTQAADHYGGITDQAKTDICTKFELSPQKLDEVIQCVFSAPAFALPTEALPPPFAPLRGVPPPAFAPPTSQRPEPSQGAVARRMLPDEVAQAYGVDRHAARQMIDQVPTLFSCHGGSVFHRQRRAIRPSSSRRMQFSRIPLFTFVCMSGPRTRVPALRLDKPV